MRAGYRCERCGGPLDKWDGYSLHHRTPRGMGGTKKKEIHNPTNLLVLCGTGTTGCHGWVEHNRQTAREMGYLVPRGVDPSTVPVNIRGHWRNLTDFGYDTFLPPSA